MATDQVANTNSHKPHLHKDWGLGTETFSCLQETGLSGFLVPRLQQRHPSSRIPQKIVMRRTRAVRAARHRSPYLHSCLFHSRSSLCPFALHRICNPTPHAAPEKGLANIESKIRTIVTNHPWRDLFRAKSIQTRSWFGRASGPLTSEVPKPRTCKTKAQHPAPWSNELSASTSRSSAQPSRLG